MNTYKTQKQKPNVNLHLNNKNNQLKNKQKVVTGLFKEKKQKGLKKTFEVKLPISRKPYSLLKKQFEFYNKLVSQLETNQAIRDKYNLDSRFGLMYYKLQKDNPKLAIQIKLERKENLKENKKENKKRKRKFKREFEPHINFINHKKNTRLKKKFRLNKVKATKAQRLYKNFIKDSKNSLKIIYILNKNRFKLEKYAKICSKKNFIFDIRYKKAVLKKKKLTYYVYKKFSKIFNVLKFKKRNAKFNLKTNNRKIITKKVRFYSLSIKEFFKRFKEKKIILRLKTTKKKVLDPKTRKKVNRLRRLSLKSGTVRVLYKKRNIFVNLTEPDGKILAATTLGSTKNVKKRKYKAPHVLNETAQNFVSILFMLRLKGVRKLNIIYKGQAPIKVKKKFLKPIHKHKKLNFLRYIKQSYVSHNGCRPRKKRRK